ncbi:MAG: hypothetical protein Fur0012_11840 [Elusimicrobiota bacterium]
MMEAFEMELIKRQIGRYLKADRKTKKKIIDEYIRLTGIKRFNHFINLKTGKRTKIMEQ